MGISSLADNGYATDFLSVGENVDAEKTEQFFKTYWFPYLKSPIAVKNRKSFYPKDDPYKRMTGLPSGMSFGTIYELGRIMFSTQDGTIYTVWIMGWKLDEDGTKIPEFSSSYTVYVDINGTKQPNRFGRDLFIFKISPENNIVKPHCSNWSAQSINANCSKAGDGVCCAAKIMRDGWQISDDYPW